MATMTEIFGGVISSYSRAQALEDGELVDVSDLAKQAGFRLPTAITRTVHALCTPQKSSCQDYTGRLWDVLFLASLASRMAVKRGSHDPRVYFMVKLGRKNHRLILHIGPGDEAEPVLTIMAPEDD